MSSARNWVTIAMTGATLSGTTRILPGSGITEILYDSSLQGRGVQFGVKWKHLTLNIFSSHASATNGVKLFDSNDHGTNWDQTPDSAGNAIQETLAATTYTKYEWSVSAPDLRVTFQASVATFTTFRWSLLGDPVIP